jgi:hypothetical protein
MSKYYGDKELFASPEVSQYGSHMVMTNVVKPTRVKYINLDTTFCDDYVNNTTNSNNLSTFNQSSYTFTLPQRINDIKSIKVHSVEIPMSFYNISKYNGNNSFYIKWGEDLSANVLSIPDGNYSTSTLITTIKTLFAANSIPNFDISLNPAYNRIFFTNTSSTNDVLINFAISADGSFDKNNFKNKLGWMLGFRKPSYTVLKSGGITTGESVININWKYLYLALDEFSNGNQNSFASQMSSSLINKNILSKIVLNRSVYDFGSILPATIHMGFLVSDKRTYNGKIDVQKINVQLINEYGNIVNLNGADFSLGIEIEYE